ncbi:2'-5' RNA ligase family protein [Sulfurovum mangrovi]|uniref:2'-5' RNA ligase family protein n=1 Tax=Sulfurovum mangrovi TaxID=2893889 RepID=UPI001E4AD6D3|nr:2'-5' RNA ligase family protein [Sulfurovum mangrovi]UFH59430.1 RNA 2',3'-cyclic phosphodiesterase [Sulfurovum mangrovi]
MRLFIASPVILDDYAAIKEEFKDIIEGTWVAEENLHMTWVFLGEKPKAHSTIAMMSHLSNLESEIEIAELGYFGRPPKIFFARAEQKTLYEKARDLKEAGFDLYRFKPHITLCRIKAIHDYRAYKEKMKEYREKKLGIILPQIALYESKRTSKGLEYQSIYEIEKPINI